MADPNLNKSSGVISGHSVVGNKKERPNLSYISNLRSSLTALVILHHTACAYGGVGSSPFQSSHHAQASSPTLVAFNAVNQSFFMGTFMFLGGHFSSKALRRKSTKSFVRDRLRRLGLPSLLYTLFVTPIVLAISSVSLRHERVNWGYLWDYWKGLRGVRGPVWFTATLLAFDLVLVGFREVNDSLGLSSVAESSPRSSDGRQAETDGRLSTVKLCSSLALCSASDFLIRLSYPVGIALNPLGIQPAYLSQYIATYVFGAAAETIEDAVPASSAATCGLVLLSGITSVGIVRGLQHNLHGGLMAMIGGWNTTAAYYALWNNVAGYMIAGSLLLPGFKRFAGHDWGKVNALAYPAFLLHMPVLILIAAGTQKWRGKSLTQTAVVGTAAVVGSWSAAYAVDALREAGRESVKRLSRRRKRED